MKKKLIPLFSLVMLTAIVFAQEIDTLKDTRDGKSYKIIKLGDQVWMAENLNANVFTDGTAIPQVIDASAWSQLNIGAWCWYGNISSNGDVYGKLYNWYTVMGIHNVESLTNLSKRKKLCPSGWHIPTDAEWTVLVNYLGKNAGSKLKTDGWPKTKSKTDSISLSGFNALPGGSRNLIGSFEGLAEDGYWWSATEYDNGFAWNRSLFYDSGSITRYVISNVYGYSVRCIKDK